MASDKQASASSASSPHSLAKPVAESSQTVEGPSSESQPMTTTLNAAMLPAGLFKRQSSSSLKRRMSNSSSSGHIATRSPILHPQSDRDIGPGPQRFTTTSDDQSKLINALEAEEEAMVLALSRKLENLRAEKIDLENTLSMEQEGLVNRLQRQLAQLLAQQQEQQQAGPLAVSLPSSPFSNDLPLDPSSSLGHSYRSAGSLSMPVPAPNLNHLLAATDPANPPQSVVLEALQSENASLRDRLADAQSNADRATTASERYRQELIVLRTKAGMDTSDLIRSNTLESSISELNIGGVSTRHHAGSGARGTRPGAAASSGAMRIPGVSYSPPIHSRSVSGSKYGQSYSPSMSSGLSPGTPYSSTSSATHLTTPSTSYQTPMAPASTPTGAMMMHSLPSSADTTSVSNTPYGSMTSSASLAYPTNPPPSMASSYVSQTSNRTGHSSVRGSGPSSPRVHSLGVSPVNEMSGADMYAAPSSISRRLSATRHGARVAETGFLQRRSSSQNIGNSATNTAVSE